MRSSVLYELGWKSSNPIHVFVQLTVHFFPIIPLRFCITRIDTILNPEEEFEEDLAVYMSYPKPVGHVTSSETNENISSAIYPP